MLEAFIGLLIFIALASLAGFLLVLVINCYIASHYNAVNRNYNIIMHAIHNYRMDTYSKHRTPEIDYEDMIDISDLLERFWDWGYKHILPPDKYEMIKEYIKK